MRGLLAMEQREVVADVVNTCMLSAIHGLRKWDPRPQVLTLLTLLSAHWVPDRDVELAGGKTWILMAQISGVPHCLLLGKRPLSNCVPHVIHGDWSQCVNASTALLTAASCGRSSAHIRVVHGPKPSSACAGDAGDAAAAPGGCARAAGGVQGRRWRALQNRAPPTPAAC